VPNGQEEKETIIMEDDLKHTHMCVCVGEGSCLVCHFVLPKKEFDFLLPILWPTFVLLESCVPSSQIFFWGVKGGLPFFLFGQQTKMMSLPSFVSMLVEGLYLCGRTWASVCPLFFYKKIFWIM
jgi:hypothetical protein